MVEQIERSGKATASLVLGILSFCFWILAAIPGLILGIVALNEIGKSQGRLSGQGMAVGGIVLNALGLFMIAPAIIGILVALLLPGGAGRERSGAKDCVHEQS